VGPGSTRLKCHPLAIDLPRMNLLCDKLRRPVAVSAYRAIHKLATVIAAHQAVKASVTRLHGIYVLAPPLEALYELPTTRKQSDRIWIAAAKLPGGDPPKRAA
jgi:hypothetical protein